MPTYEYECTKCGHQFEVFQKITDKPRSRCPRCSGKVKRLISGGSGLIFKGSGFYITENRSKSYKEKARSEGGGGSKSGEGKPSGEAKKPGPGKKDSASGSGSGKKSSGEGS